MFLFIVLLVVGILFLSLIVFLFLGERRRLLLPSTWFAFKVGGIRNLLNLKLLRMYIYGRWTSKYLGYQKKRLLPRLSDKKKKAWADHTHFKILTPDNAKAVITLDENISLHNQEQIVPYSTARDIILKGPPEVVIYECGCRLSSPTPCQPTQVCMVIGKPFTDFILEHHPQTSRRISPQEALDILEDEHKRGHLHSAWFKEFCLDRLYAICNCCTCCCIGVQAVNEHNIPMAASSGYVAHLDDSLCTGCSICEKTCPFNAITVEEIANINWESCMGCSVCVGQCPEGALSMARDKNKGEPLDVTELGKKASPPHTG